MSINILLLNNSIPTYKYGQYTQCDNTYNNIIKIILNTHTSLGIHLIQFYGVTYSTFTNYYSIIRYILQVKCSILTFRIISRAHCFCPK